MSTETAVAAADTSSSSSSSAPLLSPQQEVQQIIATYKAMRANISELASKVTELDSDKSEHALVIRAIAPLPASRKCYRSIGGVLVERSVGDVLPAVERNLKGIEELISQLTRELRDKEKEADEFRLKYNIAMGDTQQVSQSLAADTSRLHTPTLTSPLMPCNAVLLSAGGSGRGRGGREGTTAAADRSSSGTQARRRHGRPGVTRTQEHTVDTIPYASPLCMSTVCSALICTCRIA